MTNHALHVLHTSYSDAHDSLQKKKMKHISNANVAIRGNVRPAASRYIG